jgi:hypothetical protein
LKMLIELRIPCANAVAGQWLTDIPADLPIL